MFQHDLGMSVIRALLRSGPALTSTGETKGGSRRSLLSTRSKCFLSSYFTSYDVMVVSDRQPRSYSRVHAWAMGLSLHEEGDQDAAGIESGQ